MPTRPKELFAVFEQEFGGHDRLVRVIATQTGYGNGRRSEQRLAAFENPAEEVDALAITTYFAFDLEQWIVDQWPVTVDEALDELESRVGEGPFTADDVHGRNENKAPHYELASKLGIPVVAYEGGPHFLPERRIVPPGAETPADGKKPRKVSAKKLVPEIQDFIQRMERTPRFGEIYQQYLARHHASGLEINTPFVLLANWRDSGQWGHVESLTQPLDEAVKVPGDPRVLRPARAVSRRRIGISVERAAVTAASHVHPGRVGTAARVSGPVARGRHWHGPRRGRDVAASGLEITQAVGGCQSCGPFRGSLLTGRYPHHAVPGHEYPLPDGMPAVAQPSNEAGYRTAYLGKWHVDRWRKRDGRAALHTIPRPRRGGFPQWLGYDNNNSQ